MGQVQNALDNRRSVDISKDPLSNYDRKVLISGNTHDFKGSRTILETEVVFYDADGNDVSLDREGVNKNGRFNHIKKTLIAFDEMVNPADGLPATPKYLDEEGNEVAADDATAVTQTWEGTGAVKEYDYFCVMTPAALGLGADASILDIMNAVYDATIAKKDAEKAFD